MKKAKKLFLSGSVQGMFFELFVQEQAKMLGLAGFLRKLEDGRLEVFIEGDGENVDSFITQCKEGHQHVKIRNIEEKDERFQGMQDFKILKFS